MLLAWAAVGLVAASAPVGSQAPSDAPRARIGVLPIEAAEDVDNGLRAIVLENLIRGLERGEQVDVLGPDRLRDAKGGGPCSDDACWSTRARALNATHVVELGLQVDGRNYAFEVRLIDASTQSVVASTARDCAVCGVAEVGQLIEAEAAPLPQKVLDARRPATVAVASRPPGASIEIDGNRVGLAPATTKVPPGKHRVRAELPGHLPTEQDVVLGPGMRESVSLVLAPVVVRERAWDRALGWTAVGGGVGLIGAGVPLIAIEERPVRGRCNGAAINPDGLCRYRYRTLEGGVVLAAVGVAVVATGIVLLARRSVLKKRRRSAVLRARLVTQPWIGAVQW